MRNMKRITIWLVAALLVLALAAPSLAVATPVTAESAPAHKLMPDTLRAHQGGWLDDVPVERQADVLQRTTDWLNSYTAQSAPRPPVDPEQQRQQTASWTVMVFIAGDNNLEEAALYDINEMEAVGSSPDVNILVEIDRAEDYTDMDGDWTDARRYYIQQDSDLDVISSPVVEDLGETNSGSAETMADFAIWGMTNYPAEKYMLILWDHGGAWMGHFSDDESGDDTNLPELVSALDRVKTQTGVDKFEVIGFDMCLMGQAEVFESLVPYAHYGIGSEENEPGAGWFYVFLEQLVNNPTIGGAEVGRHVVDYYMYFFREIWGLDEAYGLGAVDLAQSGGLIAALDTLNAAISANPTAALSAIADARNNTVSYGGFDDPQYYDFWSSVDLYQFSELLSTITTQPDLQAAAQGVMRAIDSFVVHQDHHEILAGSHGVSIYFPRTLKAYKTRGFNERYPAEAPASMAGWVNFLSVLHGTATDVVTTAPNVSVVGRYPDEASIYNPAVITLDVSGRDILQVTYAVSLVQGQNERLVLDYDYLVSRTTTATGAEIINWADGVTQRVFTWEAEVPMLTDGTTSTYALLVPNRDNPEAAIVNGVYQSVRGGDPIDAQLVFDLNTQQSTALWGINETAGGSLQPFQIQVAAGDTFQPLRLTLDADYNLSSSSLGDTLTLQDAQSISFSKVPAPSGNYAISFVAENVAGESTLSETVFQVNNDGLDPAYRGYTDLTYGVNFRYPATWIRPRFTPDGLRLFTADLATDTLLSLFPYTNVSSAAETDTAIRESWNDLDGLTILNQREVTISGVPAFVTDYTYSFNGAPRIGAVIAIYVPDQNVGYAFDLDAPQSNTEPALQAFQVLVDSINFFDIQAASGSSIWQTVTLADGRVSFPVPSTWLQEGDGAWTLYRAPDTAGTFLAFGATAATGQTKEAIAQQALAALQQSETNLQVLASEPYYVGNEEWHLVVFTYDDAQKMAGAFFATTLGTQDYILWIEAPDIAFDQLYADTFSVAVNGFTFIG